MIRPTSSRVHSHRIEEEFRPGNPGRWIHPDWEVRFPWLIQGTTGRGPGDDGSVWDFALFTDPPSSGARTCWEGLGRSLGFPRVVHSHQVHGRELLVHSEKGHAGLLLAPEADGHLTSTDGILLGVTVADCAPVFLVDSTHHAVGLLHAGWRGAVSGVLESGIRRFTQEFGSRPDGLYLHLGPAICGDCYEVGPEVHMAMGLNEPDEPAPVDLRGHLVDRAISAGIDRNRITESSWCTLCEPSPFFSHRRGEKGRQVGFLGILPAHGVMQSHGEGQV